MPAGDALENSRPVSSLSEQTSVAVPSRPQDPVPASIRPEPRGLAEVKSPDSIRAASIAELPEEIQVVHSSKRSRGEKYAPWRFTELLRWLIPAAIILLVGFSFINITRFLNANSLTQKQKVKTENADTTPLVSGPLPTAGKSLPAATTAAVPSSSSPTAAGSEAIPAVLAVDQAVATISDQAESQTGLIASRMVEQFLAATTFEERMMYVQSRQSHDQLRNTILSRKWPTAHITPGAQVSHPEQRLVEYYFEVRFGENSINFPRKATLLVHQRASNEPKIIVEPLLDTVGGRLREFAKRPSSAPQDFYVIMDARVKCFDDKIPNSDRKCTFFLRPHMGGEDIATAYANEISATRKEFDNPLTGLKWKNPMPVLVTLQWNTTEDYTRPFIEVLEIKSKTWSP